MPFVITHTGFSQQEKPPKVQTEDFGSTAIIKKVYGKENKLCRIKLEPKEVDSQDLIVLPLDLAEKFIETRVSTEELENLKDLITYSAGCTSISVKSNESLSISKTHICTNENGVRSVSIKWKSSDCE